MKRANRSNRKRTCLGIKWLRNVIWLLTLMSTIFIGQAATTGDLSPIIPDSPTVANSFEPQSQTAAEHSKKSSRRAKRVLEDLTVETTNTTG